MSDLMELPVADLVDDEGDEDDGAHIVCCNPNRALCGEKLHDEDFVDDPIDEAADCEACVNKMRLGTSCGARFCRIRSAWRGRWSS